MALSERKSQSSRWKSGPGTICAALNCSNYKGTRADISWFSFPKHSDRCAKWVQNLRRADLQGKTPDDLKHRRVCGEHFEPSQFINPNERKKLIWSAVPTLVDCPNPPPVHDSKRRRLSRNPLEQPSKDVVCTESAPAVLPATVNSPTKAKLKLSNQRLKTKVCRLKKKLNNAPKQSSKAMELKKATDVISKHLSGSALQFFETQIKLSSRKRRGYRWSESDKTFALSMYHASPKCYKLLAKVFALPTIRTLRTCMRNFQINPGFHESILMGLKRKVMSMPVQQRLCAVLFDEMSIKERLQYDVARNAIDGFERSPFAQSKYVANHAGVFMVRGLVGKWKQAVGYFLSSGPMPGDTLHKTIMDGISKLQSIGLIVKVLTCDQGSNNRCMVDKVGVTVSKPFFQHGNQSIFVLYDPPHLIKNVRNNFKKSGYNVNGKNVTWNYVEQFYDFDHRLSIRMAPKLTSKHIELPQFSAMRVRYATQTLSHSVAAGISTLTSLGKMEQEAMATAAFIERFDSLFNVFNSRSLSASHSMRSAIRKNSAHVAFMKECLQWLYGVHQIGRNKILPCIYGWQLSIASLIELWSDLQTNFGLSFLLTSRLNQDCLENFFSTIRFKGGHRDNPDTNQFRAAYRAAAVDSIFVLSSGSNCEEDVDRFRVDLGTFTQVSRSCLSSPSPEPMPSSIFDLLAVANGQQSLSLPEENVATYIGGYLIRKARNKFNCISCYDKWTSELNEPSDQMVFLSAKSYTEESSLVTPSQVVIDFVCEMESLFKCMFPCISHSEKIRCKLVGRARSLSLAPKVICRNVACEGALLYIINLYMTVRIHHALKEQNEAQCEKGQKHNRKAMKFLNL